jgi:hypothetical protein
MQFETFDSQYHHIFSKKEYFYVPDYESMMPFCLFRSSYHYKEDIVWDKYYGCLTRVQQLNPHKKCATHHLYLSDLSNSPSAS